MLWPLPCSEIRGSPQGHRITDDLGKCSPRAWAEILRGDKLQLVSNPTSDSKTLREHDPDIGHLLLGARVQKVQTSLPQCVSLTKWGVEAMEGQALQGCSRDWRSQGCLPPPLAPCVLDLPTHLRASHTFAHYQQPLADRVHAAPSTLEESPREGQDSSTKVTIIR